MRHQRKGHKLGRTPGHRRATLAALSNALITHKRITTTVSKARALRVYVEPLINRAKEDTTHNRRMVFRRLQDKRVVTELFSEVADKISDRPGGYTRVVKLGQRPGDGAEMAMIELVDYNDVQPERAGGAGRRRRTRRGGGQTRRSAKRQTAEASAPAAAGGGATAAPVAEPASPEAAVSPAVEEQAPRAAEPAETPVEATPQVIDEGQPEENAGEPEADEEEQK